MRKALFVHFFGLKYVYGLGIISPMNSILHKREQILQQMQQIQRMEHGSLQAQTRPSARHPGQDRGPYFKHQVWEGGRNLTRHIPPEQADALAQAIEGRKQFEQLAEQFIDATVLLTRADLSPDVKKNAPKSKPPSNKKPPAT